MPSLTNTLEDAIHRAIGFANARRHELATLPGVRVLDRGPELCGIVTIAVAGRDPQELMEALRKRRINTTAQGRPSAVLDFDQKGVEGALRVSPHYYNTEEEVDALTGALAEILAP